MNCKPRDCSTGISWSTRAAAAQCSWSSWQQSFGRRCYCKVAHSSASSKSCWFISELVQHCLCSWTLSRSDCDSLLDFKSVESLTEELVRSNDLYQRSSTIVLDVDSAVSKGKSKRATAAADGGCCIDVLANLGAAALAPLHFSFTVFYSHAKWSMQPQRSWAQLDSSYYGVLYQASAFSHSLGNAVCNWKALFIGGYC